MTRKTYCGNLLWQSGLTLLAAFASMNNYLKTLIALPVLLLPVISAHGMATPEQAMAGFFDRVMETNGVLSLTVGGSGRECLFEMRGNPLSGKLPRGMTVDILPGQKALFYRRECSLTVDASLDAARFFEDKLDLTSVTNGLLVSFDFTWPESPSEDGHDERWVIFAASTNEYRAYSRDTGEVIPFALPFDRVIDQAGRRTDSGSILIVRRSSQMAAAMRRLRELIIGAGIIEGISGEVDDFTELNEHQISGMMTESLQRWLSAKPASERNRAQGVVEALQRASRGRRIHVEKKIGRSADTRLAGIVDQMPDGKWAYGRFTVDGRLRWLLFHGNADEIVLVRCNDGEAMSRIAMFGKEMRHLNCLELRSGRWTSGMPDEDERVLAVEMLRSVRGVIDELRKEGDN